MTSAIIAPDVVGDLTLHGTTKPVVLHAVFHGAGVNPLNKRYTVGFDASAKIMRTEFGVSTYVPLIYMPIVYWRNYDALPAVRHAGGNRRGIRR